MRRDFPILKHTSVRCEAVLDLFSQSAWGEKPRLYFGITGFFALAIREQRYFAISEFLREFILMCLDCWPVGSVGALVIIVFYMWNMMTSFRWVTFCLKDRPKSVQGRNCFSWTKKGEVDSVIFETTAVF